MLAAVRSATFLGIEGRSVTVEVHVSTGLPGFQIVGLPDEACRESRDRVRAAVMSSGLPWPSCRMTVNLAPSNQRKGGSGLDLAIAIGLLIANGEIPGDAVTDLGFVGELGLDGSLRAVAGVAPMVGALHDLTAVVPRASFREAMAIAPGRVRVAANLREVIDALSGVEPWPDEPDDQFVDDDPPIPDLADVRGQATARKALEVAAAGGHHLLLVGPPGSGKTMLAQRIPGLLPPLSPALALEATMVHSAAGVRLPAVGMVRRAPFRAPHHSSSMVSLVGGGTSNLRPGEISLAHAGVLFLGRTGRILADGARWPAATAGGRRHPRRPGAAPARRCRPGSCSSPRPTRARAAAVHRARATATTVPAFDTCGASAGRCSTGSIFVSASPDPGSTTCCRAAVANVPRSQQREWPLLAARRSKSAGCSTARFRRRISTSSLRCNPKPG